MSTGGHEAVPKILIGEEALTQFDAGTETLAWLGAT
jgi:hypothetical protein